MGRGMRVDEVGYVQECVRMAAGDGCMGLGIVQVTVEDEWVEMFACKVGFRVGNGSLEQYGGV